MGRVAARVQLTCKCLHRPTPSQMREGEAYCRYHGMNEIRKLIVDVPSESPDDAQLSRIVPLF